MHRQTPCCDALCHLPVLMRDGDPASMQPSVCAVATYLLLVIAKSSSRHSLHPLAACPFRPDSLISDNRGKETDTCRDENQGNRTGGGGGGFTRSGTFFLLRCAAEIGRPCGVNSLFGLSLFSRPLSTQSMRQLIPSFTRAAARCFMSRLIPTYHLCKVPRIGRRRVQRARGGVTR